MTPDSGHAGPINPAPPLADLALPWDQHLDDPVASIAAARSEHGDTFAVQSGDMSYLFVFGAAAVRWFYDVDEAEASKGVADWRMLLRKLPDELFFGRRTLPHDLFGRDDVEKYRSALDAAIDAELAAISDEGHDGVSVIDAFTLTRRLGHRLGLASWGGAGFVEAPVFEKLIELLDRLDASDAFVRPDLMATIAANDKVDERAALDQLVSVIAGVVADPHAETSGFDEILNRWSDASAAEAAIGSAYDLVLVHLGSMSNLFAANGWLLIDLARRPEVARAAMADDGLLERCALESTRIAQRSIMMREVLVPEVELDDGTQSYRLSRGVTVATLLPLTNTDSPGLVDYRPDRWRGRRLADVSGIATRELVTTFGHGRHTCPAQPFSLYAMTETARRVFGAFDVQAQFEMAEPRRVQIGGIARSEHPCPLRLIEL